MITLTPHQQAELSCALRGPISLLTGGPGSGKTFTSAWLIDAIQHLPGRGDLAVVAPTGKAAVRITEAMSERGLCVKATTIHRLLGVMSAADGWQFEHNERNPLPHEFVFVDEPSMIDTSLMRSLLAARKRGCHMLFTGDPWQLPPVGHGAPFRDMLAAGLPQGHLTEIHRNAGQIVRCCKAIREQKKFITAPEIDLENGGNLVVQQATQAEQLIEQLCSALNDAWGRGFDPVWDCQVITPLNEKSDVARKRLNPLLQGFLNPKGETCDGNPFRTGDKIVCGKNGRLPAADGCPPDECDEEGKVYVANGEQAKVLSVESRRTIAELQSPFRVVVIPHGASDWELAYAISCHKSQGSQWPVVIVMIDPAGRRLCDSHWVTTAISRAEKLCVCIGRQSLLSSWVKQSNLWKRKTFLREKIEELEVEWLRHAG